MMQWRKWWKAMSGMTNKDMVDEWLKKAGRNVPTTPLFDPVFCKCLPRIAKNENMDIGDIDVVLMTHLASIFKDLVGLSPDGREMVLDGFKKDIAELERKEIKYIRIAALGFGLIFGQVFVALFQILGLSGLPYLPSFGILGMIGILVGAVLRRRVCGSILGVKRSHFFASCMIEEIEAAELVTENGENTQPEPPPKDPPPVYMGNIEDGII
jgi:hypothetical protein